MKRRLFSCINTQMFFKLVGFQGLVCQSGSCGRFLSGRFATPSARTSARKGCTKACETPQQRTRPVRVGEHRFEDCSPLSLRAARRRGRGRRGARPAQLLGASCWATRATHEPAEQRFLNKSPCTDAVADSEPPPEPRPRARADAMPSPRLVAAISTHAHAQQRFGGVRALPQKDVQFGARHARGLPQRLVATLLAATRRASDQRLVDADDVRTRASARGAPFRARRRGLQGPRELYNQCCYCHRVE